MNTPATMLRAVCCDSFELCDSYQIGVHASEEKKQSANDGHDLPHSPNNHDPNTPEVKPASNRPIGVVSKFLEDSKLVPDTRTGHPNTRTYGYYVAQGTGRTNRELNDCRRPSVRSFCFSLIK